MTRTLQKASREWMSRPDDERFTSLDAMLAHFQHQRSISREQVASAGTLQARPIAEDEEQKGLVIMGADEAPSFASHWSFGQLSQLVGAPAGYLRGLPAPLAADNLNYGLEKVRNQDIGTLTRRNGAPTADLMAATGPSYGRIWNADIVQELINRFGDGVSGQFTVPGEFGVALDEVTKSNTTLYASDRDMFVFLADEKNRIELPNRRDGQPGTLARGFFLWNSEVGSTSMGIGTFLFDYVCMNRMVWGAEGYQEIRIRHSSGAPGRWLGDVVPAIKNYAEKSDASILSAIEAARSAKIGDQEKVQEFLKNRFNKTQADAISLAHFNDEGRPIESLWDATVGITAYARGIEHQDRRVGLEREAGKIMQLAAKRVA